MPRQNPSPTTEDSEEARAFLQTRLALFWKVLFFFNLAGGILGLAGGGMVKRGTDTAITFGSIALTGALWWLSRRGKRSIRFCRIVDGGGPALIAIVGSFLTRYILVSFVREHSMVTEEGFVMADAYVVMIDLFPAAMFLAIRAALIPSSPRRTIVVTGVVGIPKIVLSSVLVPASVADSPGVRRFGHLSVAADDVDHGVDHRDHHVHRHLARHLWPAGRGP